MKVKIYGASDDLIEIEGDISEEFDCYNKSPKLYVYTQDNVLQFVISTKYDGCWNILPQLDIKTFDENNKNQCRNWIININMIGTNYSKHSMVLNIDSGKDDFFITRRRKNK